MFSRMIAAAAVIAAGLMATGEDAAAKTRVNAGFGWGWGGGTYGARCPTAVEPFPPYYSCYNPGYYKYGYNYAYPYNSWGNGYYGKPKPRYRSVSCNEARRIVSSKGWQKVKATDCVGKTYTFTGWKKGRAYKVSVSARNGVIVGSRRI